MLRWYDPHNGTGDVPVPRSCRKKGEWLFEDSLEKFCGATKYLLGLLRLTLFTIEKKQERTTEKGQGQESFTFVHCFSLKAQERKLRDIPGSEEA